jgi:hypothetical protein
MKKYILTIVFVFLVLSNSAKAADNFNQDLSFGSSGSEVLKLQEFLITQGVYSGPITGNFYSLTLKAVKDFQTRENISPAAGYFGPLTRTKANSLLSADLNASRDQAVAETGTSTVITESPKTTNDVVSSLAAQLNALMEQINILKQQQVAQQQTNQTIQQIQQNTQQIIENTSVTPTPITQPIEITQPTPMTYTLKIISPMANKGLGRQYVASPTVKDESNYIYLGLIVKDSQGQARNNVEVKITATDESQNQTITSTGNVGKDYENGVKKIVPYYPFEYNFKTPGKHTITFAAEGLTESVELDVAENTGE